MLFQVSRLTTVPIKYCHIKNEKNLFEFVWTLRSLVWVVFNHFLLIDVTDRSKISSNQK